VARGTRPGGASRRPTGAAGQVLDRQTAPSRVWPASLIGWLAERADSRLRTRVPARTGWSIRRAPAERWSRLTIVRRGSQRTSTDHTLVCAWLGRVARNQRRSLARHDRITGAFASRNAVLSGSRTFRGHPDLTLADLGRPARWQLVSELHVPPIPLGGDTCQGVAAALDACLALVSRDPVCTSRSKASATGPRSTAVLCASDRSHRASSGITPIGVR
jgi:hypothetical protein